MDSQRLQLAQQFRFANKTLGLSAQDIIDKFNAEHGTDYSRGYVCGLWRDLRKHEVHNKLITFPGSDLQITLPRFDIPDHIYLSDEDVVIISGDRHAPFMNYPFHRAKMQLIAYYKAQGKTVTCLNSGDMLDNKILSPHGANDASLLDYGIESRAGRESFRAESELADKMIFILGNHDKWFMRKVNGVLNPDDYYDFMLSGLDRDKMRCINKTFCIVHDSTGQKWRVTHSINYSQTAGNNSDKLATKHRSNIISHHEHHFARGRDRFNYQNWIANGMEADDVLMEYVYGYDSTRPIMKSGFVVIERGQVKMFAPYEGYERWWAYGIDPSEMFDYEAQKRKVRTGELDIARYFDLRYEQEIAA